MSKTKDIYLISYIIFGDSAVLTYGNMCSEINIENTSILQEIIEEIRDKTGAKGQVWITNIVKLK